MAEIKSATSGFEDDGEFGDQVHESKHPLLLHKITILRSSSTAPASFRAALREVTYHLGYEATAKLTTRSVAITVPVGRDHIEAAGHKLVERAAIIPILRSGLGMVDPLLELLPNAEIHHIGKQFQFGILNIGFFTIIYCRASCGVIELFLIKAHFLILFPFQKLSSLIFLKFSKLIL